MGKLEELIKEYCPDGVEYKDLKDITIMTRGTSMTKAQASPGLYPVISGGKEPAFYCSRFNREGEIITVAGSGAGAGYVQFWNEPIFVNDAFSVVARNENSTKYIYYCMTNLQERIYGTKKGGGVPHVHISDIENFTIPVPPLPVQEEIVRILDSFTELTAELTARRKQYEYYRNILLTFDENNPLAEEIKRMCPDGVEYKKLSETTVSLKKGTLKQSELIENGFYKVINSGREYYGKYDKYNNEGNAFTLAARGEYAGFVNYLNDKFWAGGLCYPYKSKDETKISTKYIYYFLKNKEKFIRNCIVSEGSIPALNKNDIDKFLIATPSIEIQQKIVDILDRFDSLCNDITEGLPAEIEARRKQYEYYRNKLLTFKKVDINNE